jgi:hypothetical protein
MRQHTKKGFA